MVSLAVFVGLATLQYESILSNLTRERLVVLAESVRGPFQAVADLGVPISTVRNADAVLERARLSDEAISAILVFSSDGNVVRSTALNDQTMETGKGFAAALTAGKSGIWHVETPDNFLVGANIAGVTGEYLGSVVIAYSSYEAATQVQAMEARLVLFAIAVFACSVFVVWIILRIVLAEHLRIFEGILSTFDRFERKFWRGKGASETAHADVDGLGFDTADFRELIEESEEQYRRARRREPAGSAEVNE
ncbi:hypothetical protein O2N63_06285 [Aliiroseovarius sp. KMU-50]|uniref:Single cache domain-containing protein n=1 Tax=Aliiroseovarius salicola TaxID=3009082 RepID=A0ABT4W1J1_9RHOB|nr:hypothetical protein [Aliiroseovarius sp. KMU-50]MDA5093692.1 hypothetical protein [Aliiroseovarius sp. KMU-50]